MLEESFSRASRFFVPLLSTRFIANRSESGKHPICRQHRRSQQMHLAATARRRLAVVSPFGLSNCGLHGICDSNLKPRVLSYLGVTDYCTLSCYRHSTSWLTPALLAENQQETTRCRDIAVTDIDEGATGTVRGGQASRSAK